MCVILFYDVNGFLKNLGSEITIDSWMSSINEWYYLIHAHFVSYKFDTISLCTLQGEQLDMYNELYLFCVPFLCCLSENHSYKQVLQIFITYDFPFYEFMLMIFEAVTSTVAGPIQLLHKVHYLGMTKSKHLYPG